MRAAVWQGRHEVSVETVPDPTIQSPTDAIIRVTSSGLCGSDLHLYEVLAPFMTPGDILGHEPMGVVEALGSAVTNIAVGDRVVIPFGIACGHCFMCDQGLQSQCETTQVHEQGCGAALFGYTKLYGQVPGGQAELLRVPHADYGPIKVPHGPADDRFLFLSDVLPTAWQSVQYADVPKGGSVVVLGLGPIGDMACRIAQHLGVDNVIGVDLVAERLERGRLHGIDVANIDDFDSDAALIDFIRERTNGRGPDAVIDAVGMEAHGSPGAKTAQAMTALMPDVLTERVMKKVGVDRLAALHLGIDVVRRGGTVSIVGVYGGMTDPMPMMKLFDKQIQIRMGQANVRRWVADILPLLTDDDPLGVDSFATHHVPLEEAAGAYEMFQKKQDGAIKVVFNP
ncbi:MAG: Alcohol dehydrogenase GroES domain protein [Ilumatobacteraceae bacterium]|nr:Alcohol dehydrogenase GroES domain protein [Ilumatobacteraceae bacterium]